MKGETAVVVYSQMKAYHKKDFSTGESQRPGSSGVFYFHSYFNLTNFSAI
ncbi:MAG: hypothetical protein ACYC6D_06715 [Melioribacteraceae bacterium]